MVSRPKFELQVGGATVELNDLGGLVGAPGNSPVSLSGQALHPELLGNAEVDGESCIAVLGNGVVIDSYDFRAADVRWGRDGFVTIDGWVEKHIPTGIERVWAMWCDGRPAVRNSWVALPETLNV